jgi:hypothetical protein
MQNVTQSQWFWELEVACRHMFSQNDRFSW